MSGDLVLYGIVLNIHLDTKYTVNVQIRRHGYKNLNTLLNTHTHTHPHVTSKYVVDYFCNMENVIKYLWSVGNSIMIISFNDFPAKIHDVSRLNKISNQ